MFITTSPRQGEGRRKTTSSDLTIKRGDGAPALKAQENIGEEAVVVRTQTIIRPDSTTTVTWTLGNDGPLVSNSLGSTGAAQSAPDGGVEPAALGSTSSATEGTGSGGGSGPSVNVVGVVLVVVVVVLVLAAALWYLCCKRTHC